MVMLLVWKLCFENHPSRRKTVQKEELGKKKKKTLKTRTCLVVLENHGEARMAGKESRGRVVEKKVRSHKICDFLSPNKMGSIVEFGAREVT